MIFLFVHIAKTAGSSVNRFFQQYFGEEACLVHQESNPVWRQSSVPPELLHGVRFVSGHIPYRALTARLAEFPLHTVTVLRNPRTHVVSHLAWIRHLKDPGHEQRLAAHTPFIQQLAEKLAGLDLSDAEALAALVGGLSPEEHRLLDNPQVRYLTHHYQATEGIQERDVTSALDTLREINTFGFIEDPQGLFASLAKAVSCDQQAIEVPHENALKERYGLDPESDSQIQALMPLIQHDLELYRQAKSLYQAKQVGQKEPVYLRRHARGHVGTPSAKGRLPGWAFDTESDEAVKLDVYLNQLLVSTIEAVRPRKDLHEKFGRDCAFLLDLNKLKAKSGDLLAVYFQGTRIELNGSPRVIPAVSKSKP